MSARASLRLLGAAGALAVASLARADAPTCQYSSFDSSEVVITDNFTGLLWQRQVLPQHYEFQQAVDYCAALSLGSYAHGWRVPSYKELLTLIDETPNFDYGDGLYKRIDGQAFGAIIGQNATYTPVDTQYWTSSISPLDPSSAYTVDFKTGKAGTATSGTAIYVRCVHDGLITGNPCP